MPDSNPQKIIYILIRYSILSKISDSWIIGRNKEFEAYRETLFDKVRLDSHHKYFENITIPSIAGAIENATAVTKCIVMTSETLPDEWKQKIVAIAEKHEWMDIHYVDETQNYARKFDKIVNEDLRSSDAKELMFATVRLDDDDGLSKHYLKSLADYMEPQFSGYAVSFGKGYMAYMEEDRVSFEKVVFPKCAQGLACVNLWSADNPDNERTIYATGHHGKIDEKMPVILNSIEPSYMWVVHDQSDLSQKYKDRRVNRSPEEAKEKVLQLFSINPDIII